MSRSGSGSEGLYEVPDSNQPAIYDEARNAAAESSYEAPSADQMDNYDAKVQKKTADRVAALDKAISRDGGFKKADAFNYIASLISEVPEVATAVQGDDMKAKNLAILNAFQDDLTAHGNDSLSVGAGKIMVELNNSIDESFGIGLAVAASLDLTGMSVARENLKGALGAINPDDLANIQKIGDVIDVIKGSRKIANSLTEIKGTLDKFYGDEPKSLEAFTHQMKATIQEVYSDKGLSANQEMEGLLTTVLVGASKQQSLPSAPNQEAAAQAAGQKRVMDAKVTAAVSQAAKAGMVLSARRRDRDGGVSSPDSAIDVNSRSSTPEPRSEVKKALAEIKELLSGNPLNRNNPTFNDKDRDISITKTGTGRYDINKKGVAFAITEGASGAGLNLADPSQLETIEAGLEFAAAGRVLLEPDIEAKSSPFGAPPETPYQKPSPDVKSDGPTNPFAVDMAAAKLSALGKGAGVGGQPKTTTASRGGDSNLASSTENLATGVQQSASTGQSR